jgi:bla regulator protein blaR1
MRSVAFCILWFCMAGEVHSQPSATQSTFEVASVKPSALEMPGMFIRVNPGGYLSISGASLRNLISYAYGVRSFQIFGGPKWVDAERFDIEARVTSDTADPTDLRKVSGEQRKTGERLKSLLADRFQLALHPETKEQPVYALVVAKGGPKLQESRESENLVRRIGRGELKGQGVGLTMLVLNLSNQLGRRVIDKTGLAARYSFDLKWTPNQPSTAQLGTPTSSETLPQPTDPDGPSIFSALQEQLGLRLESEKGQVEILIIDRAERPSKN